MEECHALVDGGRGVDLKLQVLVVRLGSIFKLGFDAYLILASGGNHQNRMKSYDSLLYY